MDFRLDFKFKPQVWLKGIFMGMADLIPGVSGGTIALITGIYEELIFSISAIGKNSFNCLRKGQLNCFWQRINGNFLFSLVAGILTSVLLFSKLIAYSLQHYPVAVWSFFFGLIAASVIFVLKQAGKIPMSMTLIFLLGGLIAYWITSLAPEQHHPSLIFVFISGAIASMAMILPGISGSYILVILGMYAYILNALNQRKIVLILIFTAGVIAGLLLFSHFLKWLFARYPKITLVFLAGFMAGSLNKVWPWKKILQSTMINGKEIVLKSANVSPWHYEGEASVITAVLMFVAGILTVFFLEKTAKHEKR